MDLNDFLVLLKMQTYESIAKKFLKPRKSYTLLIFKDNTRTRHE